MAHTNISPSSPLGGQLKNALNGARQNIDELYFHKNVMGELAPASDYAALEAAYGIAPGEGAIAKAEIDSAIGKLDTDAQVTGVKSALAAVFKRLA